MWKISKGKNSFTKLCSLDENMKILARATAICALRGRNQSWTKVWNYDQFVLALLNFTSTQQHLSSVLHFLFQPVTAERFPDVLLWSWMKGRWDIMCSDAPQTLRFQGVYHPDRETALVSCPLYILHCGRRLNVTNRPRQLLREPGLANTAGLIMTSTPSWQLALLWERRGRTLLARSQHRRLEHCLQTRQSKREGQGSICGICDADLGWLMITAEEENEFRSKLQGNQGCTALQIQPQHL